MTSCLVAVLVSLSNCSEREPSQKHLQGTWKANWTTSRAAFPEVDEEVALTMEGWVEFDDDEITITAYGYPGCIFSADTLRHSQKWVIKKDTLELLNDGDMHGISYIVRQNSADHVQLVLMGDIYLDLTR